MNLGTPPIAIAIFIILKNSPISKNNNPVLVEKLNKFL